MTLAELQTFASALESFTTVAAIIGGGWWAYWKFVIPRGAKARLFERRRTVMRMALCGVCLWLFAAVLSAAGPFDGKWTAHVMRPAPAGPQDLTITLNTDEGKVTGSIAIQGGGQSPIEWGIVKGDLIVFKLKMPFQDRTETFVYLGRLEGSQIAFGRRPENLTLGRLVEFTGIRAK